MYNMGRIKIVLTGDLSTGKTSIIRKFAQDVFDETGIPTICDSLSKTVKVDGKDKEIELWDTAGQERFRTVTSSFYKGARVVAFVFDLTRKETFDNLHHWITEVDRCAAENAEKILIGNKSDLGKRNIPDDEIKSFAEEMGLPYYETSAKTGDNIENTFFSTVKFIEVEEPQTNISGNRIVAPGTTTKKKSFCIVL